MENIPGRVYKVVLFGATGCGKSSIINLLSDSPVAKVSNDSYVCTKRSQWYPISLGEKKFRLWDTMGFSQVEAKVVNLVSPYEQAYSVLQNLGDGVDLILLCARPNEINAPLRNLYWLLDSFFFGGRAKIALILTNFDKADQGWWDRNKGSIAQRCNIPVQSLPYACITTARDGSPESNLAYDLSKHTLKALLQEHATNPVPLDDIDLSADAACEAAVESLQTHCQLSRLDATTLVKRFRSPNRPFHAVLLGEHGAGKSSIINLIVGDPVAEVYAHTLDCRSYKVNTGSHHFQVWDTIGLNGLFEGRPPESVIESAASVIHDLRRQGEIDLLVYCKKYSRAPSWEFQIFRLFREFLCESKIPVAFIITHLEKFDPMEEWWENNENALLATLNVEKEAVAGHACITLAAPDGETFQDRLSVSRELVHAMLETLVSHNTSIFHEEGAQDRSPPIWGKVTVKTLTDYCGLTKELAEELFELFHPSKQWWFGERLGTDSSNCISLPILS